MTSLNTGLSPLSNLPFDSSPSRSAGSSNSSSRSSSPANEKPVSLTSDKMKRIFTLANSETTKEYFEDCDGVDTPAIPLYPLTEDQMVAIANGAKLETSQFVIQDTDGNIFLSGERSKQEKNEFGESNRRNSDTKLKPPAHYLSKFIGKNVNFDVFTVLGDNHGLSYPINANVQMQLLNDNEVSYFCEKEVRPMIIARGERRVEERAKALYQKAQEAANEQFRRDFPMDDEKANSGKMDEFQARVTALVVSRSGPDMGQRFSDID